MFIQSAFANDGGGNLNFRKLLLYYIFQWCTGVVLEMISDFF